MFLGWKERYCSLAVETIPSVGPARAEQGRILHSAALTISCTAGWPPKATFYDTPFEKQQQRRARLMETSLHCSPAQSQASPIPPIHPQGAGDHLAPSHPLGPPPARALPSQSHHQEHLLPAPFHLSPRTSKEHHPILPARHCFMRLRTKISLPMIWLSALLCAFDPKDLETNSLGLPTCSYTRLDYPPASTMIFLFLPHHAYLKVPLH